MNYIYKEVQELVDRYHTRDPYELMRQLGIQVLFRDLGSIRGLSTSVQGKGYVVINSEIPEIEQPPVAAHELGHSVLHQSHVYLYSDTTLYGPDQPEYEANIFAAELLFQDEQILQFQQEELASYFDLARIFACDPQFVLFKLESMRNRGYMLNLIDCPDSAFLGKNNA